MDDQERARREEIEQKVKELYKHIDDVGSSLRSKISEEVGKLYKHADDLKDKVDKNAGVLEEKLEKRDREIENDSRDRDAEHDKKFVSIEADIKSIVKDLKEHVDNGRIHNKLRSMETIQAEQLPPNWRQSLEAPVHQSQGIPSQPEQATDEFSKMGVPWFANPKWVGGILAAIAAGIVAIILALGYTNKEDAPPPPPPPVEAPK